MTKYTIARFHHYRTAHNAFLIVTAYTTLWFIGFITPGVLGGIGLREAMLMLSLYFPKEAILTSAVVQRFSMVLGDVLAWVLAMVLGKCCKIERDT
jgi:uncharacterized membrane protein YbhN (UPF0104 family)